MKARHHSFVRPSTGPGPAFSAVALLFLFLSLLLAACGDFTPTSTGQSSPSPDAPTLTVPAQSRAATTASSTGLTATPSATTTPAAPTPTPVELPGGLQNRFSLPAYPGHVFSILAEALSPDRQYAATGGTEGTVRLWDTGKSDQTKAGKMLVAMLGHTSDVGALAFSPDGKLLASGGGYSNNKSPDYSVRLWEVPSGKSVAVLKGHSASISNLEFSPDGKTLATASLDGTIKLWDIATSKIINTFKSRTRSIAFSPDGKTLASSDYDVTSSSKGIYMLKFWDTATGQENPSISMPEASEDIAFSPDGKSLAAAVGNATWTGYQTFLGIYDLASGQEKSRIKLGKFSIRRLAFSPDGKSLLGGGYDTVGGPTISPFDGEPLDIYMISDLQGPAEGILRLWDVSGGNELKSWTTQDSYVDLVGFDEAGQPFAIGTKGNSAHLWNLTTGQQQAGFEGAPAIRALAYSPDGQWLASGQGDGTVHLRQAASGREVAVLQGHKGQIASLAFSPDSKTLASGGFDYQIKLWDLAPLPGGAPQEKAALSGHRSWINSLSFSPDGKSLASASSDSLVKLWDTATDKEKFTLKSHPYSVWAVAFTPDGQTLVSAGKTYYKGSGKTSPDEINAIKLWDVATGKLKGSLAETVLVTALALSPDGQTLAETTVGDYDKPGKLKFWDMASGKQLAVLDLPDSKDHSSGDIAGSQFFLALPLTAGRW